MNNHKEPSEAKNRSTGETPPKDYLIENLIARKELIFLSGPPKTGRSLLSSNIALCLAQEQPWLGFEVGSPLRVGLIQGRMREEILKGRVGKMIRGIEDKNFLNRIFFSISPGLNLGNQEDRDELFQWLNEARVDLLIVDPFPHSERGMLRICEFLQNIAQAYNCGVLFIKHLGIPSRRGRKRVSSALRQATEGNWTIARDQSSRFTQLSFEYPNVPGFEPILLCLNPETLWLEKVRES